MQVLDQCDKNIFQNGIVVMVTHTIPALDLEIWVRKIAEESGQQVDWHYVGGRAVIKAIGNIDHIQEVIEKLLPEHDLLYKKAFQRYNLNEMHCSPPRYFPNKEQENE